MNINSLSSYAYIFQVEDAGNKGNRGGANLDAEYGNRNTGPDTVSFSNEAIAKYLAMKNSSADDNAAEENEEYASSNEFFLEQTQKSGKKNKKMTTAELIAFIKSDAFAEEAMGYAKSAMTESATNSEDEEDESSDDILNLGAKRQTYSTGNADDDSDGASIDEQVKNSAGGAVVNGKWTDQEELNEEIHKVEEEIKELTAVYELIMGGEGELEEKVRLSQPVHKRLDERLKDLQALKAQARMLTEQENMMKTA